MKRVFLAFILAFTACGEATASLVTINGTDNNDFFHEDTANSSSLGYSTGVRVVDEMILLPNGASYRVTGTYREVENHLDGKGGLDFILGTSEADYYVGANFSNIEQFIMSNGSDFADFRGDDSLLVRTVLAGAGDDVVIANEFSHQVIQGANGDDLLFGGRGNDRIEGNNDNDVIHGMQGDDYLEGGAGDDNLFGGAGNDSLFGGAGNDVLRGGSGNNTFVMGRDYDQVFGGTGIDEFAFLGFDTIVDEIFNFDLTDSLNLTDILIGLNPTTDNWQDFVSFNYNNDGAELLVDRDGTASDHSFTQIAFLWNVSDSFITESNLIFDRSVQFEVGDQSAPVLRPNQNASPIPEPATLSTILLGLLFLGFRKPSRFDNA